MKLWTRECRIGEGMGNENMVKEGVGNEGMGKHLNCEVRKYRSGRKEKELENNKQVQESNERTLGHIKVNIS